MANGNTGQDPRCQVVISPGKDRTDIAKYNESADPVACQRRRMIEAHQAAQRDDFLTREVWE